MGARSTPDPDVETRTRLLLLAEMLQQAAAELIDVVGAIKTSPTAPMPGAQKPPPPEQV